MVGEYCYIVAVYWSSSISLVTTGGTGNAAVCTLNNSVVGMVTSYKPPVLSTCLLHTNSGCGKERRI